MNIFVPIFPEILLLALGVLILILDPFLKRDEVRRPFLGWFTVGGLLLILLLSLFFARPGNPTLAFGGMIRFDGLGFLFKMFFLFAASVTSLFFMDEEKLAYRAEAYVLLIASTLGMSLMASAADLVMLYLAIETASVPLYVLAGFLKEDDRSTEAGFKYLLFGAMASAVLLYGFSLVYGLTGKTGLTDLALYFSNFDIVVAGVSFLILVGLAFKISAFPFHFWAPDVYQGAPTSVAGFLSTASKAAGFAVLLRLFVTIFPVVNADWSLILAIVATLTMTVGNLIALAQKDVKRLLAYSSISHAGYALMGVVAFSQLGITSVVFYLIAYVLTNLLAFGVVLIVGKTTGSDEYPAYNGLSRRNAPLALAMLAGFLSLSGMPPFAGFVAKLYIFLAAIQAGWIWLAIVGVLNSIVGLYYYLNVLKYVYLFRLEGEDEEKHPVPVSRPAAVAMLVLTVGVVLLGTVFGPWFGFAEQAARSLF
ncbi:MAG: NADH-quinone oxidoreductase subunit N [Anaerolineales bacterium]|nr:NADH-quinone oxidoreductase subunit N [Anaerolineales bacterium]MCX7607835.1 NADH-quinone oxidoreductase subunit N [Anaerolineales bacterium]